MEEQSGEQRQQRDRGQTTLDFATGTSVFLIILISVLLFIPGSIEPFTKGTQDNIVTSNRIGDQLAEGLLGDPSHPHIVDTDCTREFFKNPDTSSSECRFTGSGLNERIGVQDRQLVNVTLRGNLSKADSGEERLCWSDDQQLKEIDEAESSGSCETKFQVGETPPKRADATVTARRVVSINKSAGSDEKVEVALVVEVW